MDSVKISELNELTVAKTDDLIPIVDTETGETKKIKAIGLGNVGGITGDTLPIGSMVSYGSKISPTNWLICDGSEISRFTYSDLFNVIGTSYGEGDGSTTFNLPNKDEADNWIIKAFQSAGVVAEVEQNLLSNSTTNVPSVNAVKEAITTNITTDGNPVKTGRIIDDKEEYVKRIDFGALPNKASKEVSSGLVYLDIKIVEIDAVALNDSGSIFILPYIGGFDNNGSIILQLIPSSNSIRITTNTDRSNVNGYINIYFTYNNV